jgi:hypothetical protein
MDTKDATPEGVASSEVLGLVERMHDWADERYVMQRGELSALRADLREAAAEIERLRGLLYAPMKVYSACQLHMGRSFTLCIDPAQQIQRPIVYVCPHCEQKLNTLA